ncbi:Steroid dehydrogenase [Paragonimus westermani]|uniref:Steroid dehydrogenase n=1 Tax=Paragonimus westermani TaxID=34504 RepID=A0A8T0DH38_9TREM|nr:Steroid dehydrogenase [Paragonimus westermani]
MGFFEIMWSFRNIFIGSFVLCFLYPIIVNTRSALNILYCYSCTSAQSGCGDPIDVRLENWKLCTGRRVVEDQCVKLIENVGDTVTVTRGCLSDMLENTLHREEMPSVRRHGYCNNAKSYQDYLMKHESSKTLAMTIMGVFTSQHQSYKRYCFCNDWNGCNDARTTRRLSKTFVTFSALLQIVLLASFS